MKLIHPSSWKEYELIDSGNFEKLEKFGPFILIRPEPQAIWQPALPEVKWKQLAHAHFSRDQSDKFRFTDEAKGGWKQFKKMPESWTINYEYNELKIVLRLALTGFGHVGIFPEQGSNWNFIYDTVRSWSVSKPRVLNLFAYTGAASVVATVAGAEVTHCDASRPGLNWANQNMQLNGLSGTRWVHEDALKFVRREARRGNKYHGVIMDPPPYGRGPDGEKWTLAEKLDELIHLASQLMEGSPGFFILSMYAAGFSPIVGANVMQTHFPKVNLDSGEFFLKSSHERHLPMGTFTRFEF